MDIAKVPHKEFDVVRNEAESIVQEQMAYLKEKADAALAALNDALDDLKKEITSASMPLTGVDYDYVDDVIESNVEQNRPDVPTFPNTDDIDTPSQDRQYIDIQMPVFEEVPIFNETAPDEVLDYSEDPYQSTLLTAVKASVLTWINDGGTGLVLAVEEGIFSRARVRLTEEWDLAFENAMAFYPNRGFNIPTGGQNAMIRRVNMDFARKLEDLNFEIAKLQAELAQNNTQFAHTTAVQLERNLQDHFNAVATRLLDAAKSTVQLLYQIFTEKVKAYVAHVQGVSAGIDAEAKKIDAQVSINKDITDEFLADTERYKSEIGAVISVIDGQAKVYAAQIGGYQADIDLAKAEMLAAVERLKALISQSRNQTELEIKEAEVELQAYLNSLGLNVEVSKAVATVLAQIAASSLSAINTHAGLTDSSSRSYSGSYSHNEGLQNSMSYNESKVLT